MVFLKNCVPIFTKFGDRVKGYGSYFSDSYCHVPDSLFSRYAPQQKRERERQALIRSLSVGDDVVTHAGIHGVVVEVEENVVWLEVAPNVELKILKDAVTKRVPITLILLTILVALTPLTC